MIKTFGFAEIFAEKRKKEHGLGSERGLVHAR